MSTRTLSIVIIAILVAGAALYSRADVPVKTAAPKPTRSKQPASPGASETSVSGAGAAGIIIGIREWGEEAPSLEEAERRMGRKIRLADEGLTGGKPIFRHEGNSVAAIYPNAWISSFPWMWPGKDPKERYAEEVAADNAHPLNPGDKPEKLIEIAGNPGYAGEGGYNILDGVSTPRPAYVHWEQDGIEHAAYGYIPLVKLLAIAESVANSN